MSEDISATEVHHGADAGSDAAASPGRTQPQRASSAARAGLLFGALVAPGVLGVSASVIALPALVGDLGFTEAQASWLLVGYVLTQAVMVAVFGRLADVRGLRAVLLTGAALIAVGTVLSTVSGSFLVLVGGRLIQGAGAGSLQVVAFGTVGARYAGADRAKVMGVETGFIGVVSGAGTLIGGLLIDATSWRVVFALPALSLLVMARVVRQTPTARSGGIRLDVGGAALFAILASAVVLLLESSSLHGPRWQVPATAGVAVLTLGALAVRVRRVPDGFVPPLVRSGRYTLAALTALTLGAGYLGMLFAAPLLLGGQGWSATQVGLILLPAGVIGAASARLVGTLSSRHNPFRITATLAAISAAGLLLAGLAGQIPVWTVLALGMAVSGFAAGQVALLDRIPPGLDDDMRGVGTGLLILMFLLGGAVGTASVAGLTSPLGLSHAVAVTAILPAAGVLLALAAGSTRSPAPNPG